MRHVPVMVNVMFIILLAGCAMTRPPEFVALFDGKTITGWAPHPQQGGGQWTVESAAITAAVDDDMNGGSLCTQTTARDFFLTLDVLLDWPSEASIILRSGPDGRGHEITFNHRPGGEMGTLNCPFTQGIVARAPDKWTYRETPDSVEGFLEDDWNQVRIKMMGEPALIQLWINNQLVTDFLHAEKTTKGIPREGPVCLQFKGGFEEAEGKKARFRNILLKKL